MQEEEIHVLSIDIGIHHLGLSMTTLTTDYSFKEIIWVDVIDITDYKHKHVSREDCKLYHTKTFSDWIDHVHQENQIFFESADVILLERQPPGGINAVEQLLFKMYRNKTHLIHPRNVHSYLNIGHVDYDTRKIYSVKIASRFLPESLLEQTTYYDRSHDIADSICIMLYWRDKKQKEWKREQHILKCSVEYKDVYLKLETFRFI
jgi:hypothetical protein